MESESRREALSVVAEEVVVSSESYLEVEGIAEEDKDEDG